MIPSEVRRIERVVEDDAHFRQGSCTTWTETNVYPKGVLLFWGGKGIELLLLQRNLLVQLDGEEG